MTKTAVVESNQTTAVATTALEQQFLADANGGFEEADSSSFAIPFLQVLQSGSPQCKKSDGAYIKGAEEGMLYNSVTQEVYSGEEGLIVIPCHYQHRISEWKLREQGGGFVASHDADYMSKVAVTKDDKGRDITPQGTQLVDTRYHYVMICGKDGSLSPALILMASTQQKRSKQWMSKMQGIKIKDANGNFVTAPMASRKYKITTVAESNDKGSWFSWNIQLHSLVEDMGEYRAACDFRDAVKSGAAKMSSDSAKEEF